ncbi:MAG TPA: hypothetical protein VNC78_05780 [Actinomycetota bacterium]|nr:hypothetical protein [Actinomycetota bacterium]
MARAWAAPSSVIGLLLSPLFRRRSLYRGTLLCEGAHWPRRLGWRYRAITFGHVILGVDELDVSTLRHELVHVKQYERWGPLFLLVYLGSSLAALRSGGAPYRDNRFEIEARAIASMPSLPPRAPHAP